MSGFGIPKSPERLAADQLQIESLVGPGLFLPEGTQYQPPEFRARTSLAGQVLRHARTRSSEPFPVDVIEPWVEAMNGLQAYCDEAERDPSSSLLRPGQIPVMRRLSNYFEEDAVDKRGGHVVLPTSTGKTVLFTELIHATGLRALIAVPTKELIRQTHDSFKENMGERNLDIGFVYQNDKTGGKDVTITTYASLTESLKRVNTGRQAPIDPLDYDLVIYDEGHLILGEKRRQAIDAFSHATQIAFTATDEYSEYKRVSDVLPIEIVRWDIIEGQDRKLVAPHHNIVVHTPTDMRQVRVASTGDYAQEIMFETINTDERNRVVIDTVKNVFPGKKAMAFCAGVEHSKHLAELMNQQGIAAAAIDGNMTMKQREAIIEQLKLGSGNGGIDVICNDRVLGAGFSEDTIEVALMVSPTLSPLKLLQNGGRATRLWSEVQDKVAYIVQFIDSNYVQPPLLFAESNVTGYAQHGYEGFNFPLVDTSRFTAQDVNIITDPDEVQALAAEHAEARTKILQEPPEGWLSLHEVAEEFKIGRQRVRNALNRYSAKLEKQKAKLEMTGKETDEVFDFDSNIGRFLKVGVDSRQTTYISPEMAQNVHELLNEYKLPPTKMWRTTEQIAALYDRSSGWAQQQFCRREIREAYPDEWGKFGSSHRGSTHTFYSPNYLHAVTVKSGRLPDYSQHSPSTWRLENEVIDMFGQEAYDVALERADRYAYDNFHQSHRLAFGDQSTETMMCSPHFIAGIRRLLDPGSSPWRHTDPLHKISFVAEVIGEDVTEAELEAEIQRALEKDSSLAIHRCGKYLDEDGQLLYYCDGRVAAHILEQILRRKYASHFPDEKEMLAFLKQRESKRARAMNPKRVIKKTTTRLPVIKEAPLEIPDEIDVTPESSKATDLQSRLNAALRLGQEAISAVKQIQAD